MGAPLMRGGRQSRAHSWSSVSSEAILAQSRLLFCCSWHRDLFILQEASGAYDVAGTVPGTRDASANKRVTNNQTTKCPCLVELISAEDWGTWQHHLDASLKLKITACSPNRASPLSESGLGYGPRACDGTRFRVMPALRFRGPPSEKHHEQNASKHHGQHRQNGFGGVCMCFLGPAAARGSASSPQPDVIL